MSPTPSLPRSRRGVEDAANAADSIVVLCNSDDSAAKEQRYLQSLEEQRVQGVLITPVSSSEASVQRVRRRGIAVVLLDHPSRSTDLCSVAVDDVLGGELAAIHLFAQGHRRIGFIHGPLTIRQIAERQRGVLRAVKRLGLDPQTAVLNITVAAQNTSRAKPASNCSLQASSAQPLSSVATTCWPWVSCADWRNRASAFHRMWLSLAMMMSILPTFFRPRSRPFVSRNMSWVTKPPNYCWKNAGLRSPYPSANHVSA